MGTRLLAAIGSVAVGATLLLAPTAAQAVGIPAAARALPAANVLLAVGDHRLTAGESSTAFGQLLDAVTALPVVGETLTLQVRRGGTATWVDGATGVTDSEGRVVWGIGGQFTNHYRVVHPASALYELARSDVQTVLAKPTVTAELTRSWVTSTGAVRMSGTVAASYPGEQVVLQRRVDGVWRNVERALQGQAGRFAFRVEGRDVLGPQRYRVLLPERASHLADASSVEVLATVRVVTYRIETRGEIRVSMKDFRQQTDAIYADPRGWSRANVHFKRVRTGGAFSLVLSEAAYVPRFAPICDRYWSCRVGRYVIINQSRWRRGTPYFRASGGTLSDYRAMVVNHETGHWFGLGHATCGGKGRPAPVMMQQSKGLYGCEPNPWPLRWEVDAAY